MRFFLKFLETFVLFLFSIFAEFVVIAFGLFFVFSEKQPPDKKMRNFRKTVVKPASIVTRRFSSISSRGSITQVTAIVFHTWFHSRTQHPTYSLSYPTWFSIFLSPLKLCATCCVHTCYRSPASILWVCWLSLIRVRC